MQPEVIFNGETTLNAIAELLFDRIGPAANDEPYMEFEDVLEEVRNSYQYVIWEMYMKNRQDGERNAYTALLRRKRYPADNPINVSDLSFVSLPYDAGVAMVIPYDDKNQVVGRPFVPTNPALAYMPSRIKSAGSFYRVQGELFFPEGYPDCVKGFDVLYMGVPDDDTLSVPRDIAEMTRDKCWNKIKEGREIPADNTNNSNPNA